jgi:hypothetical protein
MQQHINLQHIRCAGRRDSASQKLGAFSVLWDRVVSWNDRGSGSKRPGLRIHDLDDGASVHHRSRY